MRKILLNSILIFSLLISSVIIAQEEKELFVNSIKGAIKIDGLSNEIQWEKAKWAKDFWMWRPTDSIQAKKQTRFKMLRDEQNLYILIEVTTNGNTFTTPSLKRDFEWYESDSVTLLFDTFNDQTNAFSFATNPLGLKSDGLMSGGNQNYRTDRNYAWDTKWIVETKIEEGKYTAEFKIPFSAFFYDNTQTSWRFNIFRRNFEGNETSSWAQTPQNQTIGNLAFMGKMIFEKPLKKAQNPISIIPYLSTAKFEDFENNKRNF
ncbi:MAG: carbohydrate binding family 9 domain-containing protein, partial [Flavobacteriaceae bacterium]|nr:carbohydrate binding family 9 domain-containing protein [Flavobacteriaceae bacterium]